MVGRLALRLRLLSGDGGLWNDIIVGAVVIVLAAWAATKLGKQVALQN